jgi:hypothetical protein
LKVIELPSIKEEPSVQRDDLELNLENEIPTNINLNTMKYEGASMDEAHEESHLENNHQNLLSEEMSECP